MPPLALDDQEMAAVMDAATLVDPAQRGAFLEELAAELAKCPGELGPGTEPYARSSAGISTSSASANFRSPGHGNRGFPNRTGLDPNMDPNGGRGISRASKTEPR
jgi:hypothetical protein